MTAVTADQDRRTAKIERLIALSSSRHDAFEDVDWSMEVDPEDPRLELFGFDPLSWTDWYQRLPAPRRSEVGLARTAANLRTGWEFENLLQQGLLHHAWNMSNTNASFRYLHEEVMDESQHTLMFHEFIRRHAPHVGGMGTFWRTVADPVVYVASRHADALFYFMVLGGEIPIDHLQRQALKLPEDQIHPLLRRLMEIHVEEEARHVAFANEEIRRIVPALDPVSRHALSLAIPVVLGVMVPMMSRPAPWLIDHYRIPRRDLRRAYSRPEARRMDADSCVRIQRVCESQGLMSLPARQAWRAAGLHSEERSGR